MAPDTVSGLSDVIEEQGALGLAVAKGLPWADLVLEVGFGAGMFLIWRIAHNWWPETRHIAIDPLPVYAAKAPELAPFGVQWVQAVASDGDDAVHFCHEPAGLTGAIRIEGQHMPPDWPEMPVMVTTLDTVYGAFRQQAQALWVRIDCPQGIAEILRGATTTLQHADLLSVVLNVVSEPLSLAMLFQLVEPSGLRCFRLTDWHYDPETGRLLSVTVVFVRLEKMPNGLAALDPESLAITYAGLDQRRSEHVARIEAICTAAAQQG